MSENWTLPLDKTLFSSMEDNNKAGREFHVDFLKSTFKDFARNNLYRVVFNLSTEAQNYLFTEDVPKFKTELLSKAINFPNFELSKLEIRRMGQRLYLPASQSFGELQFTILCDDEYTQRKFLHSWLNSMTYSSEDNTYKKNMFLTENSMDVYQLDNKMKPIFGARFTHCFPSTIGEIQMGFDSTDTLVEFPVSFSYSQYHIIA
jgi:hypothetical protein